MRHYKLAPILIFYYQKLPSLIQQTEQCFAAEIDRIHQHRLQGSLESAGLVAR